MRNPHSDFIQPIKRSLKAQPLLANPKIWIVFRYLQRYLRYWQFCIESYCACTPPLRYYLDIKKKPQITNPFRKPQNFNRFSISSTVLEILAILYRKLLRTRSPHSDFFSANKKKPQITNPFRKPQNFNRFSIFSTVLEIFAILYWKLPHMRTPHYDVSANQ